MQENINKLLSEFERIKEMGWIKEKRKGLGGCGYTLETLLKKEEDNFPWPDYNNIEIKTMNQKTKNNLHLFYPFLKKRLPKASVFVYISTLPQKQ